MSPVGPAVRVCVVALVAALFLIAVAPASAVNGWWKFRRETNINSTLFWIYTYPPNPTQYSFSWRAGSGTSTDACEVGKGWLPTGWYTLKGHWNGYEGSKIKGRVWWVQDKQCSNGTWRTELFIHTEENSNNGQTCTSAYDDPFCWERVEDHYSQGCIKLSYPTHISSAHSRYHDYGGKSAHGDFADDANELYVYQ
jgi:hypothetical protein